MAEKSTPTPVFTFSHPLVTLSPAERSLWRVLIAVSVVIGIAAAAAFFVSSIVRLRFVAVLLLLMGLDWIIHSRRAAFSVYDLFAGRVPGDNVALCMTRQATKSFAAAFARAQALGGDVLLDAAALLAQQNSIAHGLERLDVPPKDFAAKLRDEAEAARARTVGAINQDYGATLTALAGDAALVARAQNLGIVDSESVFVACAQSNHPRMRKVLDYFSVLPHDINAAMAFGRFWKGTGVPSFLGGFAHRVVAIKAHRVNRTLTSRPTPTLDGFSEDLTDSARQGLIGFLIGHDDEYTEMVQVLSRQGRRNVVLVGDPGSGREALVEHVARDIVADRVPKELFDRRLVKLSVSDLIAGATQDELSGRFTAIAHEITRAGNVILFIPDVHELAQTAQAGGISLLNILSPIIRGDLFPVIGTTTPKSYKEFMEARGDLGSLFDVVHVHEMSHDDAFTLLSYDALVLEREYRVRIKFSAIRQAVELGAKYLHPKLLPESAQDLLKEALAQASQHKVVSISGSDIIAIVERKVNVPIHKTSGQEAQELLHLEDSIHKEFVDQEAAVTSVARALRAYRAGLARTSGPMATFLFAGPTGVGKTELSKVLARLHFGSEQAMVRFDMTEYQQKESIVRFIGSPDGRIAGALTEAIIQKPYSLILLDEFEKANPDLLNLFLQVFDDGRLTDGLGRVIDFQNTIIIATSNANSVYIQDQIRSGKAIVDFIDEFKKKLTEYFRPELINRFSDIVVFEPLPPQAIEQITRLNLEKVSAVLQQSQGIALSFSDAVVRAIAQAGYDPAFGARPLRKAIDDYIRAPLSEKILAATVVKGQSVVASVDQDGRIVFDVQNQS
ncbi:MAG: ATP-dependent Clp protease ATP-binding subunit [Candidatus Paceibacterota bacterium]|jgi:ATP-dependent Clp protease ATP-binding subunit ClpC